MAAVHGDVRSGSPAGCHRAETDATDRVRWPGIGSGAYGIRFHVPPARRLGAEDAEVLGAARPRHRSGQALHGDDRHVARRARRRPRRGQAPRRPSTTSCSSPSTTTTTASSSTASSTASCARAATRPAPAPVAPATGSTTSCPSRAATRSARWRWPTPVRTPTAASSSSCPGSSGVGLPPLYSLFGKVVKGLDVVEPMQRVATDSRDRPHDDVVINSVTISDVR